MNQFKVDSYTKSSGSAELNVRDPNPCIEHKQYRQFSLMSNFDKPENIRMDIIKLLTITKLYKIG